MISKDVVLPISVVSVLGLMILPVPSIVLDLLLAVNITAALAIMLTSMHIEKPLDFSVFPSLLLVTTLLRLGLNVSSTRLIMLEGHNGTGAAGKVIETFGNFVVGGNYVVGAVVFLILIIINFIVITKGSGRIAEVSARFTLDALPGRQMSIDSDMAAGLITQEQARNRRESLARETDFYGAMDGANKFVRGDAIAGLVITLINIIGGLVVGVAQAGLSFSEAARTYTVLTIGDGLVSQIPSLIIATAAGLVVTRSSKGKGLGTEVLGQTFGNRRVLGATAAVLGAMSFIPGLPMVPFLGLAGALMYARRKVPAADAASKAADSADSQTETPRTEEEEIQDMLPVEPLTLEVGYSLVSMVTRDKGGGELLDRIIGLRKRFAKDLGVVIPQVNLRDSLELSGDAYRVLVHGVEVAKGEVMSGHLLAMDPGGAEPIDGVETHDPAFGIAAKWISNSQRDRAEMYGYTVVEPPAVIATHLSEIFREHASDLVGRQELQELIDVVARRYPKVVDDLIPGVIGYADIHAVIRNLLSEGVSIRDLRSILEAMGDAARVSKSPIHLTEAVRQRIGPAIAQSLTEADGKLYAALLDPNTEATLRRCIQRSETDVSLAPDLATAQALLQGVQQAVERLGLSGRRPVLVAPADLRYALRAFVARFLPQVVVVSQQELPARLELSAVATGPLVGAAA